jgi:hypothetical protein
MHMHQPRTAQLAGLLLLLVSAGQAAGAPPSEHPVGVCMRFYNTECEL